MSTDWGPRRDRLVMGVPREAFRPSPIFLAMLALFVASGVMAWNGFGNVRFDVFLFVVSGWIVSLCLHEYAHAVVAFRAGDLTVADRGYLTLNPLKYSNPLLSIILPVVVVLLGGIGLPGGAVWVEHGRIPGRLRHTLISLAGPLTNVVFALLLVIPFALGADIFAHTAFWAGVGLLAFLQITASVLNLLPVPGLDGGNIIQPWLSPKWKRGYALMAPYGFLLIFALLWHPVLNRLFFDLVFAIGDAIGLPNGLYQLGYGLMRFWQGF
jgi:Zn-dependent protease